MGSYDTAKESKTCACGMRKVRILDVRGRQFVNARARIFRCTHGTPLGSIQQKYSAPSAGSIIAHLAPCTLVLCSGTLLLLQDTPLHPRRVMAAEFIKIWKWKRVHPSLHVGRSAPRHSAVASCTLCRIHRCTFYHVYYRTRLLAATLNRSFWARELGESFPPIRPNPLAQKDFRSNDFAQNIFTRKLLPERICAMPYARKRN